MVQNMQSACPACGKVMKLGQKFCTSCGAKLDEAGPVVYTSSTGGYTSSTGGSGVSTGTGASMQMPTTNDIDHIRQLIREKAKGKEIVSFIENFLNKLQYCDDESSKKIYDLIAEALQEDRDFFMSKIYKRLYNKTKRLLSPQQRFEMEKYIIENYSFFKGEQLLGSSSGKVIQSRTQVEGRVFVTNQRIIVHGFLKMSKGSLRAGGIWALVDIEITKKKMKDRQKMLDKADGEKRACFGYQYPFVGAFKIKKTTTSAHFKVRLEIKEGKRQILKTVVVTKREKGENAKDFRERREKFLIHLIDLLNTHAATP